MRRDYADSEGLTGQTGGQDGADGAELGKRSLGRMRKSGWCGSGSSECFDVLADWWDEGKMRVCADLEIEGRWSMPFVSLRCGLLPFTAEPAVVGSVVGRLRCLGGSFC